MRWQTLGRGRHKRADAASVGSDAAQDRGGVPPALFVSIALGYGCYLAAFPFGPIGTTLLVQVFSDDAAAFIARALSFVAIGLVMLAQRRPEGARMRTLGALNVSYACAALIAVFMTLVPEMLGGLGEATVVIALAVLSVMYGLSLGLPELGWYEAMRAVYEADRYRGVTFVTLAAAAMSVLGIPLSTTMLGSGNAFRIVVLAVLLVSWACAVMARRSRMAVPNESIPVKDGAFVPISSTLWLITLVNGILWAVCCCLLVHEGFARVGSDAAVGGAFAAGIVVCAVLMVLYLALPSDILLVYGMNLRLSLLVLGVVFALLPLLVGTVPFGVGFACYLVYQMLNVFNPYFATILLGSSRLAVHRELPANYGISTLGALVGTVAYVVVFALLPTSLASGILIAMGTILLFALAPMLPARSSNVSEIMFNTHRGIDNDESRRARAVAILTDRYGLTAREAEVLALILEHRSREEIAESLSVSPSTVKNHATRLYAKLDVHSSRELEDFLRDGGLL